MKRVIAFFSVLWFSGTIVLAQQGVRLDVTGNALFDGSENDGTKAAVEILSGNQRMLLDGNEIEGLLGLYLNFNSGENVYLRTNDLRSEINMEHENGSGTSGNGITFIHPGSNNEYWTMYVTNGDGNLELYNQGSLVGEFNDASGNYNTISDRRLKHNIRDLDEVLPTLGLLQPKIYNFKKDKTGKDYFGFIAQEVEEVFPNLVNQGERDTGTDTYTLDYTSFGVLAIAAVQEMQERLQQKEEQVEQLEAKVVALKKQMARFSDLADRMATLENKVQACCAQQQLSGSVPLEPTLLSPSDNAFLQQNAPNPFNEQTTIQFYLPQQVQHASLQIVNQRGKLIRQYDLQTVGIGQVQVQAGELPAGIYAYTLRVNDVIVDTRQMVLTK